MRRSRPRERRGITTVVGRVIAGVAFVGVATTATVGGPVVAASAAPAVSVTNCNDSGAGSLRQTVATSSPGETINFNVTCTVIDVLSRITINHDLAIAGPTATSLRLDGGNVHTIFVIGTTAHVTISHLSLVDAGASMGRGGAITNLGVATLEQDALDNNTGLGCETYGGAILNKGKLTVADSVISGNTPIAGAGIYNWVGGTLDLVNSTVSNNVAGEGGGDEGCFGAGGGLYNSGSATITGDTFSGNDAGLEGNGGAIYNAGSATIVNSTFFANNGSFEGGAIVQDSAQTAPKVSISLSFVTIVDNTSQQGGGIYVNSGNNSGSAVGLLLGHNSGGDCSMSSTLPHLYPLSWSLVDDKTCAGVFSSSAGAHDIEAAAKTASLAANGGPTKTVALRVGSPAIRFVTASRVCPHTDQRNVLRTVPCDIGAWNGTPVAVAEG